VAGLSLFWRLAFGGAPVYARLLSGSSQFLNAARAVEALAFVAVAGAYVALAFQYLHGQSISLDDLSGIDHLYCLS
jgi:hypothetical protein